MLAAAPFFARVGLRIASCIAQESPGSREKHMMKRQWSLFLLAAASGAWAADAQRGVEILRNEGCLG